VRVIVARRGTADDASVTRRAWILLVAGVLLAGAVGGFALANRGESAVFKPTASWNMFRPAQWRAVQASAAARGFTRTSLHVVAATSKGDGTPLALLAGRQSGRTCFVPVAGHALGRTVCKLDRPLVVFAFRDHYGHRPVVDVLGLARPGVQSVAGESMVNGARWVSGVALVHVQGGFAFAGGASGRSFTYVGRNAAGRVLTRVHVAP
jgi:hypothetical protein